MITNALLTALRARRMTSSTKMMGFRSRYLEERDNGALPHWLLLYQLITYEGAFPGARRRLSRDLYHFVELNETSSRYDMFVPICSSARIISVLLDFRPILRNAWKIQTDCYSAEIYHSDRSNIDWGFLQISALRRVPFSRYSVLKICAISAWPSDKWSLFRFTITHERKTTKRWNLEEISTRVRSVSGMNFSPLALDLDFSCISHYRSKIQ